MTVAAWFVMVGVGAQSPTPRPSLHIGPNAEGGRLPIRLTRRAPWRVEANVRFGELRESGARVVLRGSQREIFALEADAKGLTALSGGSRAPVGAADRKSHSLQVVGNGQTIVVFLDGREIGRRRCDDYPDELLVVRSVAGTGETTQIWVDDCAAQCIGPAYLSPYRWIFPLQTPLGQNTPWEVMPKRGTVRWLYDSVVLEPDEKQASFPMMRTRPGILPAGEDWAFSFDFRFPTRGLYRAGFGIYDGDSPTPAFEVSYDDASYMPRFNVIGAPAGTVTNAIFWHTLYAERIGGVWAILLDGKIVHLGAGPNGPVDVVLGSDLDHMPPSTWSTVAVRNMKVAYLRGRRF